MTSRTEPALQRLLRDDPALRRDVEGKIFDFLRKYNRDQPRVPAGNREGGQWTSTGSGQGSFGLQPGTMRPLLQRPSVDTSATPDLRSLVQQAFVDDRHDEDEVSPLFPMDGISSLTHPPGIRPLNPMEGLEPSVHFGDILALPLAIALYRWLSASNGPSSQAVIKFNAQEFHRDTASQSFDRASVQDLDYQEVRKVCESIDVVQSLTDNAVKKVLENGGSALSPTQFGTAVHLWIKQEINRLKDEGIPEVQNFEAEVSLIKSDEADKKARYGEKGSIRVDVLDQPESQTACVYDIKSGRAGLSLTRSKEIASNVFKVYGPVQEIIVTEIRPKLWRPREK